jgi:hypothetical protein
MGQLFKVGDLVKIHKDYHPSSKYYCKVMNITDQDGIDYDEYDVITGWGDKNSKLKMILNIFAYKIDYELEIHLIEPFIKKETNMNNISLVVIDNSIESNLKKIELLKIQNEFFNKFRNRQEKIDLILE